MAPKKARLSKTEKREIAEQAVLLWGSHHFTINYREGGRRDEYSSRAQIEDEDQSKNQSIFENIITATKFTNSRHSKDTHGCGAINEILRSLGETYEEPYRMNHWVFLAAGEIMSEGRASLLSTKQWKTLEAWADAAYKRHIRREMLLINTPDEDPLFRKWHDDLVWLKESKK